MTTSAKVLLDRASSLVGDGGLGSPETALEGSMNPAWSPKLPLTLQGTN